MRGIALLLLTFTWGAVGMRAAEVAPGADAPAAPADPIAITFVWDHYRSVAVIGDGIGQRRPAWIGTWDLEKASPPLPGPLAAIIGPFGYHTPHIEAPLAVAYRGLAWRDARGRLHVVAKGSALAGPQADQWSPDSFVFDGDAVHSEDDNQATQDGRITHRATPPSTGYEHWLLTLQVLCGDGI